MADVNHVLIIGRLTRDSELKYTSGGMAIAKLSLAVNKRVKKGDAWEEKASFFDVTLWGKTAEGLNRHLVKGKQIAVEGELEQERWEKDGKQQSKVSINARNIQLLGGGGEGRGRQEGAGSAVGDDGYADDIPFDDGR